MIKFFRKIRQSLISEGKTGKYLKYALGEIILVVIGILIALNINNWNEQRITDNKEQNLLNALKQEFIHNQKELIAVMEVNRNNIKGAEEFAAVLSPDEPNLTEAQVAKLWNNALRQEAIFRPSLGVLNEAISSGNLSIIKNNKLRIMLSSFGAELQQLRKQEETVFDMRMDCYQSLRNSGNFRKILDNVADSETWYNLSPSLFENSNKALLQSEKFENEIVLFIGTSVYLEKNFLVALNQNMKEIIELIKAEPKRS